MSHLYAQCLTEATLQVFVLSHPAPAAR